MTRTLLLFDPLDTLWFREGRPFEQMDEGLAEARAVFPPSPATLAGAIALAAARAICDRDLDPAGRRWDKPNGSGKLELAPDFAFLDASRTAAMRSLFVLAGIAASEADALR